MKIIEILGFMGIGATLSWSKESDYSTEYSDDIDLSKLPINYQDGHEVPSNEDFHDSAKRYFEYCEIENIKYQKRIEYPSDDIRISAIEKQLREVCQKLLFPFCPEFMKVLSDIEKVDTKYIK
jgi:hypothetical protein